MQNMECEEDREGTRFSNKCSIVHTQVGDRYRFAKNNTRKIYFSKPDNDTSVQIINLKVNGVDKSIQRISGGFTGNLLEPLEIPVPGQVFTTIKSFNVLLVIETVGLNENLNASFNVHCEWRVS